MAHVVFSPAPRCRKNTAYYITATRGEQLDEVIENTDRTEFWRSSGINIRTRGALPFMFFSSL